MLLLASSFFGGATLCSVPRILTSASAASAWRYSRSMYVLVVGDLGRTGPGLGSTRLSFRLPQRAALISIFSGDSVGSQTRTFLGQMRVRPAGSVWGGGASYITGTAQLWTLAGWVVLLPGENKYIQRYIRTHWHLGG